MGNAIKFAFAALMLAMLCVLPANADPVARGERTQETTILGDNRFLIFVGSPDNGQTGYTVDLIKIDNGIPYYVPLFMEEYDVDTGAVNLSDGVAFMAEHYRFDRAAGTLEYTSIDRGRHAHIRYKYKLNVDILTLQEVVGQKDGPCADPSCKTNMPRLLYKAKANAQTH
jgi:hypothetical protein